MIRVCLVTPNYKSYSETFIQNHIEKLPGEKTIVYSLGNDGFFEDGTPLLKMNFVSRFFRMLERMLLNTNIQAQESHALARVLKRKKIKIVLAEYGTTGAILTQALQQRDIPLVVHFHGYDAYQSSILKDYEVLYRNMFSYAKAMIVVSGDMEKKLIELGGQTEKIKYIPYGINLNIFKQNRENKNFTYFLAVGRFVEKKAPYLTILAFLKVQKQIPTSKLVMVGTGPLYPICKRLVKSLGIDEFVDFKGVISNEEVSYLMYNAYCYVQHSITPENGDSEGTPLAILEASASGLPVVSTKHAGIIDAVLHGESGYLVEEGDIEEMADYMIKLCRSPELAYQFGKRGNEWVSKQYNLEKRINNLWEVLSN